MNSIEPETTATCRRCNAALPSGALVCKRCHTLVHAEKLQELSASAKFLEEHGETQKAREAWTQALALLPPESQQWKWVTGHLKQLESTAAPLQGAPKPATPWLAKFGPVAILVFLLTKGKALLLTLGAFLWVYWQMFGWQFGLGFTIQILIHELGHYIDIRRRGLPADMPLFLPGLGAFVRWQGIGVTLETRAAVSLAGPLAGWFAAAACAWMHFHTGEKIWGALAAAGAWLNLMNLIPVWALDGSQAFLALGRQQRAAILGLCILLFFITNESAFLLVAMGAGYRLFTKDLPENPSPMATAYFSFVLILLGAIKWLIPGTGFAAL